MRPLYRALNVGYLLADYYKPTAAPPDAPGIARRKTLKAELETLAQKMHLLAHEAPEALYPRDRR